MKKLLIILILLLLPALCFAETYTVERVINGDTFKLTNGETVRLIGVDSPEIDTGEGKKVTEFTKMLAEGKMVFLEFDVEKRDRHGRLLAYVYIDTGMPENGHFLLKTALIFAYVNYSGKSCLFLNAAIIGNGYATPMTIPPNVKYADLFKKLYQEAREDKRGLWRE